MKIGLISDSHDHVDNLAKAVALFKQQGVSLVLHAGDYVNPGSVKFFEGMRLTGVFGNNDGERFGLIRAFHAIKGTLHGDFGVIHEGGLKIALYHGTEAEIKQALGKCGDYDVVVTGHTHKWENMAAERALLLNPGTAHGFGGKATVMILDTEIRQAEIMDL